MLTPAYTTMDPTQLHFLRDGFQMPDPVNFRMLRRAGLMGLGQIEDYSTSMVPVEESSWLDNIGDFFGDTIESIGRQLPTLLGQEPPVMQAPGMTTTATTQRGLLSSPVVLIGLGVAAYFLLAPKSRRR